MCLIYLILTCSLLNQVSETEGGLLRARQPHDTNLLPMLIYFSSENCSTCAQFDALFEEPEILKKMEQHYVSVRVSIDDYDGKACADIYNIRNVPALVIADHKGIILYRSDATLSVQDIQLLLESIPGQFPNVGTTEPVAENSIQKTPERSNEIDGIIANDKSTEADMPLNCNNSVADSNTQNEVPKITEEGSLKTMEPDPISNHITPVNSSPPINNSNISSEQFTKSPVSNEELKDLKTIKPKINETATTPSRSAVRTQRNYTYGIQLGFFSEAPNAKSLMQKAKLKGLTEARTDTELRDGKSCYRVMVGSFPTLSEAQKLLEEVKSLGFKAAVYRQ